VEAPPGWVREPDDLWNWPEFQHVTLTRRPLVVDIELDRRAGDHTLEIRGVAADMHAQSLKQEQRKLAGRPCEYWQFFKPSERRPRLRQRVQFWQIQQPEFRLTVMALSREDDSQAVDELERVVRSIVIHQINQ
jgi:hypothetical protein